MKDPRTGLAGRTNPILVGRGEPFGRFWADLHGQSEETIGTNSIQDYFRFGRDYGFLDICAHQGNDFQISDGFWKKIQATTRKFHEPGRLVTFPGWEWSGNTALGGDRNVLFREEGGPINRSSRALLSPGQAREPCCRTVEELFGRLRDCRREVMVLPHVGGRYADLSRHDPGLEWAVEVHSAWGTFEWMLADAFARGHRLAIVANSDGHKGRPGASYPGGSTFGSYGGLTCVLAKSLTRRVSGRLTGPGGSMPPPAPAFFWTSKPRTGFRWAASSPLGPARVPGSASGSAAPLPLSGWKFATGCGW